MFLLRPLRGGSAMFNSRCTISFAAVMAAFCLALDGAADTFTVTSATEFQEVLNTAAANGEHDTINVAAGTYNLATTGVNTLTYTPVSSENFALTIVGEGGQLDGDHRRPTESGHQHVGHRRYGGERHDQGHRVPVRRLLLDNERWRWSVCAHDERRDHDRGLRLRRERRRQQRRR